MACTTADLERLFTRDAPEAYRFFSRNIDFDELQEAALASADAAGARGCSSWRSRCKLTPARRLIYGIALVASLIG